VEGLTGAGLPQSYPFKLLDLLHARYRTQSVVGENEGRPGEAASGGARRLPEVLRALAPEVVILLHGVNDITAFGRPAIGQTAAFLNAMARDARLAGAEVVLCTLPPQRAGGARAADPGVLADYNAAIREIARGEGAILVDFAALFGDSALIGADGLHPVEAGYARMAQLLFDILQRQFEVAP
jgi:lysophospholipase L1-like esterase